MELNDLKDIWLKEKNDLESRLIFNEKLVREMSLEKSKGSFDKLITVAIINRNFTFILMMASTITASIGIVPIGIRNFEFSILYIGAGSLMVLFFKQMSFQKPSLSSMSTIELQKSISQFRSYILDISKYNPPLWGLYLLSMIPVQFKAPIPLLFSIIMSFLIVFNVLAGPAWSRSFYKKQDKQLKEIEEQLNQILEFEKNN